MQRAGRRTPYHRLAAWALRSWIRLTSRLSLAGARRLGFLVGDLAFWAGGSLRRVTRTNLSVCYPNLGERALLRLTRDSLRQTGCYAAEAGFVWRDDGRWQSLIADVAGAGVIDAAAASGRALLFLGPHFGNWEFVNLYLGRLDPVVLYERLRVETLDPIVRAARARTGSRVEPIDAMGLRRAIGALRRGKAVALLPDQVPSAQSGEYAPFFGRDALTMTLAHRLVERFRPNVILAYARRLPHATGFRLVFERLAEVESARTSCESLGAMNAAIERVIALDPAQYQWEYRRFRRPSRSDERLY